MMKKNQVVNMRNKKNWKILMISFVAVMVVSCTMPCIAVDNSNNASDHSDGFFTSENITANNMPFPYHGMQMGDDFPYPYFDPRHGDSELMRFEEDLPEVKKYLENVSLSSATIYVPDNYTTIQAAVDAASPGDTIIVIDGTYIENVDVSKRLTIKSENGAEKTIVQAANPDDHVFEVTADYVNISGFTVKGTAETAFTCAGINIRNADYC
ncbi:MAG: hypothetical protein WAV32_07450, partial [Halobacteriota archaeon]